MIPEILTGPRVEEYRVELLDDQDRSLGWLDGVGVGGRVTQNYDAPIRGGMAVDITEMGQGIDWMRSRFRPWVRVNGASWPLGVYLPASPDGQYSAEGLTYRVSCLDKTSILADHLTAASYSVPAGAVVTAAVRAALLLSGETRLALTDSALTARELMVWPAGTSLLSIVNDLLESIHYGAIWCDGFGQYRAEPFVPAGDRQPVAVFAEGEASIHSPEFARTQDITAVPNKVVLVASGGADVPLIGTATNERPGSPYSYAARGRWVVRTYSVEAADQATINSLAQKYLWTASTPEAYLSVAHAVVPLEIGDAVQFTSAGLDALAVVNEFELTMSPGSLVRAKWQEITP